MQNDFRNNEPPVDPLDDTHPTQTIPQVNVSRPSPVTRLVGLMSLLGALGFTAATVFLLLNPSDPEVVVTTASTPVLPPTDVPIFVQTPVPQNTVPPIEQPLGVSIDDLPTLDPETAAALLSEPMELVIETDNMQISRNINNPFTIIPERPRNEIITYTVQQGDTIGEIAQRFGLQPESIVWSNSRRIIQVLRPGDELLIPPVDGVIVTAVGSQRSIADYADIYRADDVFNIIDSPFNQLGGFTPETVPPSGTQFFIPGGEAEEIVWNSTVEVGGGDGSGGGAVTTVTVDRGQPGSCGPTAITGGTVWSHPVPSGQYFVSRGYASWHPGIDLAHSVGVPIAAANGGRVAYAGWHNGGYGSMIAIVHGPTLTVYGHLSQINVTCGQDVASGSIIGLMGSSGNSSGPHLHFEIRSGAGYSLRQDPAFTISF